MLWPEKVQIVEVGPRDGLQSLARVIPTEVKSRMIEELVAAGLRRIEVTSFVRPDVVPQLADAEALVARLPPLAGVTYRALVPNARAARRAADAGMTEITALIMASETYNKLNQNMSIEQSLVAIDEIAQVARDARMHVVGAVGLALFCPYEGEIPRDRTLDIMGSLVQLGIDEAYVATSAGADGPRAVYELCSSIRECFPQMRLGVHLHDANGMAAANAVAAAQAGVTTFESSICGLGGGIRMPDGPQRFGNIATEDLVNLFSECGVDTGIEVAKLVEASYSIAHLLGVNPGSSASRGGTKRALVEQASSGYRAQG